MQKNIGHLISPFLVIIAFSSALAAPPRSGPRKVYLDTKQANGATKNPKGNRTNAWLTVPFDTQATELPAHFLGHNPGAVFKGLEKTSIERAEFETSASYEERKATVTEKALFGNVYRTSPFAFTMKPSDEIDTMLESGFTLEYDADSESLIAKLHAKKRSLYVGNYLSDSLIIQVNKNLIRSHRYLGQNAFGVSVVVKQSSFAETGLVINLKAWPFQDRDEDDEVAVFTVQMTPEVAKKEKPKVRLILIGRLREPWTASDTLHDKATIDEPYETIDSWSLLNFVIQEIWVLNESSGAVLQKFVP